MHKIGRCVPRCDYIYMVCVLVLIFCCCWQHFCVHTPSIKEQTILFFSSALCVVSGFVGYAVLWDYEANVADRHKKKIGNKEVCINRTKPQGVFMRAGKRGYACGRELECECVCDLFNMLSCRVIMGAQKMFVFFVEYVFDLKLVCVVYIVQTLF